MENCLPRDPYGNPFLYYPSHIFSECIYSYRQSISLLLGNASLGFWIISQLPQLYLNYKRGSASAMSKWFISSWLLGDICNLVGCLLTHAQPFQVSFLLYIEILICICIDSIS